MAAFRQHEDRLRTIGEGEVAERLEAGALLHALALRYWADWRLADALRVDLQAAQLVGVLRPAPTLLSGITSTIEAITRELHALPDAR